MPVLLRNRAPMRIDQTTRDYFESGDADLSYAEEAGALQGPVGPVLPAGRVRGVPSRALPNYGKSWSTTSAALSFDEMAVRTIREGVLEPEKHEALIARSRAHTGAWVGEAR